MVVIDLRAALAMSVAKIHTMSRPAICLKDWQLNGLEVYEKQELQFVNWDQIVRTSLTSRRTGSRARKSTGVF